MVNLVVDLLLSGEKDHKVLTNAWNEMQVEKDKAMEEIGLRLKNEEPNLIDCINIED